MIRHVFTFSALLLAGFAQAAPHIDEAAFGKSLGGWKGNTVSYELSGSNYRTYKPEVTPTPDGGLFVSLRIDHLRGVFSSNDHAVLEITLAPNGTIASAQSSLALQGISISSDLIRGGADAGAHVGGVGAAVKIGGDLVADLSSKMLRERIVEAGRVSFPAVLRHNYNHLYQAIRTEDGQSPPPMPAAKEAEKPKDPKEPEKGKEPAKPAEPAKAPESTKLDIKPFGEPTKTIPEVPKK